MQRIFIGVPPECPDVLSGITGGTHLLRNDAEPIHLRVWLLAWGVPHVREMRSTIILFTLPS